MRESGGAGATALGGAGPEGAGDPESLRRAIFEAALDCIVVIEASGRVVEWNAAAEQTFGHSAEEAIGRDLADLIIPARMRGALREALAPRGPAGEPELAALRLEVPAVCADGSERLFELRITKLPGTPPLFAGFMRDVTERVEAQRRLEEAERHYRELVERLPVAAYLADCGPAGRWHYVSTEIERMVGFAPHEWLKDPGLWHSRVHPDDRESVLEAEERCLRERLPLDIEYRLLARDGRVVWVRDTAAVASEGEGIPQVEGVLSDISDRKRAEDELRYRADHDELTGAFNRRRFEDELRRFRKQPGSAGAIAIVNVDNLQLINESLGHVAGDAVLRGVAGDLQGSLREAETLARLGGDEFVLLLRGADERQARTRSSELLRLLRSGTTRHPVTASAGIAVFGAGSRATTDDMLSAADIALFEAKEAGGDRVSVFRGREGERLAWVGQVRAAIEGGRFALHSQPIFPLGSREPLGEELFVRMLDEGGGLIAPSAFLPTAERFGLVRDLDRWVVARAARIAAGGHTVAVNLSAQSIGDRQLTEMVADELSRGVPEPGAVLFEVTETAAASAIDDLRDFAARVERIGCWLAIDDFGTGFGTLTYIKHLPVRYLKIDMEFVQGMAGSIGDQRVVKAIVTIAEGLGMRTVAEGVEDGATLALLQDYGVDFAQGYHLGRPAPVSTPA